MLADKEIRRQQSVRTMKEHDVIGITTTACAGRWEILRALEPEILICEEAGEVMEAHALCTLLPTLKHSIFIGDPLQLRPAVNERLMTLETGIGSLYRLDESLFERIMTPRDPTAATLPTAQLNIQRRMHPQIAELSRITYPFLKDHGATTLHPSPKGIADRLFWLDHRVPETIEAEVSDSVCNLHEVEVVRGFVHYLLRGSGYSHGDIAVLTPYAAQLSKLHNALQSTCPIWISDRDREILLENGHLEIDADDIQGKTEIEMSNMLRIATVDNFQGEEAKIIILSTVRSGDKPGFLKTRNRINVGCSRARDGFYIIGNASTLSQVPMWNAIIKTFDKSSRRGPSILLQCDRHAQHNTRAKDGADFEAFEECSKLCNAVLPCGHYCQQSCHDPDLHDRIPCLQPCEKVLSCGHLCPKACFEKCGFCEQVAEKILLPCGHSGIRYCSGEVVRCTKIVEERNLPCGKHTVEILCGDQNAEYTCAEKCGMKLTCGHDCPGSCAECQSSSCHQDCIERCSASLPCGHKCGGICHDGRECPPCQRPCQKICPHGRCKLLCSQACDPCHHKKVATCEHEEDPDSICSLPSPVAPCSLPCTKLLSCGHICPSLHNEICLPADKCLRCADDEFQEQTLLYSPRCGHMFELEMSDIMNFGEVYDVGVTGSLLEINPELTRSDLRQPRCPECGSALSSHRYKFIEDLLAFPRIFDLYLKKIGQKVSSLSVALELTSTSLGSTFKQFMDDIRPNPLAAEVNTRMILRRHKDLQALRSQLASARDHIIVPFERAIVRLHAAAPKIVDDYNIVLSLRATALEYRAMHIEITDRLRIAGHLLGVDDFSNELQRQAINMLKLVYTECIAGVVYCQNTIEEPKLTANVTIETEIRLQQVRFYALCVGVEQQLCTDDMHLPEKDNLVSNFDVLKCLDKVEMTALNYPSTCKSYLIAASHLRDFFSIQSKPKTTASTACISLDCLKDVPMIHSPEARVIERRWGKHVVESLTVCKAKHPYSSKAFPEGCPDCGKYEETEEERSKRAQTHLFEADFLAAMKN